MNIFYCWQSDLDKKYNETFIEDCLNKAIKNLNENLSPKVPLRLDRDTRSVPGSPDIANTIFAKIDKSDVFVGDLSFIAKASSEKYCSNPNVLIELGYALKSLTYTCIVNVMNTAHGEPKDNLQFDFAHKRWPIQYELSEENKNQELKVRKTLVQNLEEAIEVIYSIRLGSTDTPLPLNDDPSIENINRHIMSSNPKDDWQYSAVDFKSTTTYKKNVMLRIEINKDDEGTQCKDFQEPWANKFPDPSATGYWCDIFYGTTRIKRTFLVSVDGGRAMLPTPDVTKLDENGHRAFVDPFTYKLAEIFDTNQSLYTYFHRAGFKLLSPSSAKLSS